MLVTLTPVGNPKGGETTMVHDLNFGSEEYEANHTVTFRNPKPELAERLRESGPVGDAANGTNSKAAGGAKKKAGARAVDMEKLASGLERMGEDDLLHVVQLVHDNKSEDTYTKNDVESESSHWALLPVSRTTLLCISQIDYGNLRGMCVRAGNC